MLMFMPGCPDDTRLEGEYIDLANFNHEKY